MANSVALKQFQKALGLWPKDLLRPHVSFQDVMQKRLESKQPTEAEANALLTLVENRYRRQYPLNRSTMHPASDPEYYNRLTQELEEAPQRTWLDRLVNKITGTVRWK